MATIDPATRPSPVPELHELFETLVTEVTGRLGKPALHNPPVQFRGSITWSALWFVDMHNSGFHIKLEAPARIALETWSHQGDLSQAKATVKTVAEAERILRRIMPEALDPARDEDG